MRHALDGLARKRGQRHDASRLTQRLLGERGVGEVRLRFHRTDQQVRPLRMFEHRLHGVTDRCRRATTGLAMRHTTREPEARRIATLGQQAESRTADPRELSSERTQIDASRMTQRHRSEPDDALRAVTQRCRRRAMRVAHHHAVQQIRKQRSRSGSGEFCSRLHDCRKFMHPRGRRCADARRHREVIGRRLRLDERHARLASHHRLAQAMREQRNFSAEVATNHQYARQCIDLGDWQPKRRVQRIG